MRRAARPASGAVAGTRRRVATPEEDGAEEAREEVDAPGHLPPPPLPAPRERFRRDPPGRVLGEEGPGGLAGPEREGHPGPGERVDDARGVADEKEVAEERLPPAEVDGLADEGRTGLGNEPLEVGGEARTRRGEPREEAVEVVVGLLRRRRRRERSRLTRPPSTRESPRYPPRKTWRTARSSNRRPASPRGTS